MICPACTSDLDPFLHTKPEFHGHYIYRYGGMVRDIIRASKYKRRTFIYLKELTKLAAAYVKKQNVSFTDFFAVPIPTSKENYKKRGFNQVEIIGKVFAKEFKLKMLSKILSRQKETGHQYDNDRRARAQSLSGAFVADASIVYNRKILLVDDIVTTGTTFNEARTSLLRAGAKEVFCLALAG